MITASSDKLILIKSCESTQDEAFQRLHSAGTRGDSVWVLSAMQSRGRGRRGSEWLSMEGNLFLSGAFRIEVQERHLPQVSLLAACVLARTLNDMRLWHNDFWIKWPNDLYAADAKLAGILCEFKKGILLVGLGMNVRQAPEGLPDYQATCLAESWRGLADDSSFEERFSWSFIKHCHALLKSWSLDPELIYLQCLEELKSRWRLSKEQ